MTEFRQATQIEDQGNPDPTMEVLAAITHPEALQASMLMMSGMALAAALEAAQEPEQQPEIVNL